MEEKKKKFYFFAGTVAELIKIFPVMKEMESRGMDFKIIASGQNDMVGSPVFKSLGLDGKVEIKVLSRGKIRQTALGLFWWFVKTFVKGLFLLMGEFIRAGRKRAKVIVHGDTVTTVMGALMAKIYGLKVIHIEAGLRSFDLLHPFPEEIDRIIASRFVDIHFCPNQWAVNNLNKKRGEKVNTIHNTLIESLEFGLSRPMSGALSRKIGREKYCIFVTHRQENIYNENLIRFLTNKALEISEKMKCVFIVHEPTRVVLEKLGLMERLKKNENIITQSRLSFFDFVNLYAGCEFIITDGGSNQEESFLLGKPCLVLRHVTERVEGLGTNVVLSKNNPDIIDYFVNNYGRYSRARQSAQERPSKIIVDKLAK